MTSTPPKVLFITGVNSGLGRSFAEVALSAGHQVIGTVRSEEAKSEFDRLAAGRGLGVVLDVTDFDAIPGIVAKAQAAVGTIDVLVNNAGYGHEGPVEESPLEALEQQFATNVFGPVALIKAVLPAMRQRRTGHIINVTSMGGFITMPGIAYYCGSKFALEGISEALAKEVKAFGIKVTALAPGQFRTDWAGRSMIRSPRSVADYDEVFDPVRKARQDKSGKQQGDPQKAAQALLELLAADDPPVHLFLGTDALNLVNQKIEALRAEMAAWEGLSKATDFA